MKKIILFIGTIAPPQEDIMVISMPELSVAPIRTAAEKAAEVIREFNISCDTIAAYIVDCSSAQLPVTDISAELKRMNDTLEEMAKQATIEIKDTELIAYPGHVRDNYDQRRQRLMAGHPHKTYWHRIRSNPG